MLSDCPLCGHRMQVRLDGLSLPKIQCADCGCEFDRARDWVSHTRLKHVRRTIRKARLRVAQLVCQARLQYLRTKLSLTKARLWFWEIVASSNAQATPRQSERLTGIEVAKDDE